MKKSSFLLSFVLFSRLFAKKICLETANAMIELALQSVTIKKDVAVFEGTKKTDFVAQLTTMFK